MFTRICALYAALAIALAGAALLSAAEAKGIRFVASYGDDSTRCLGKRPCRTLQRGIESAPPGGVVLVVDSAKYGPTVTINKSITIAAVGARAVVDRIVVNAPGASVVLRGLLINGTLLPAGTSGIDITAAASVHIVACEIERFAAHGLLVNADNADVLMADTAVRGNSNNGLFVTGAADGTHVTIRNSRFEANGGVGILVIGPNQATVERSVAAGNRVGLNTALFGLGPTVRISESVFVNNTDFGVINNGGTILSRGNNTVSGNGTDIQGIITPLSGI